MSRERTTRFPFSQRSVLLVCAKVSIPVLIIIINTLTGANLAA